MRIAGLVAVTALVAACSQSVGGEAERSSAPLSAPPNSTTVTTDVPPRPSPTAGAPPGAGAPIDEVIAWAEAGSPADPDAYHEAYLDGVTTRLGDDIAFTAPSGVSGGTTQCITDEALSSGGLICLLDLDAPAARPDGAEGEWKAGWIDYPGASMQVGSLHGDPGPFVKGVGARLTEGQSLAFGDYRCRSDAAGLLCVNYAHRTAAWISAAAVVPFGCLQPVTPPPGAGPTFSC
ncbi:MAG: hypothetical protein U1D00_23860 [Mycobacterium sp.]|nr:hypothetical protein [Mycobacterium sp.]